MSQKDVKALLWVTVIVAAELLAFALLQKALDDEKQGALYTIIACLLFGIIVPLAFKEALASGNMIAAANLYWIVLSQIGSVVLGYWVFKQNLTRKEMVAIPLLLLAVIAQFFL
jgi:multidrug transporter EmrE-like cation transporter